MDRRVYEIWLSLACTPDTSTFPKLLKAFSSAEEVYNAEEKEIRKVVDPRSSDCSRLLNKELDKAKSIYEFCQSKGIGILAYFDDNFPESLKDIPTPPVLLYYRGQLPDFNSGFRCAVVGTRALSEYGRVNAFKFSYDLGYAGATIVSGMAIGIDGVALAGAIASGATAIAVLGSGIDICYPKEHITLAREIVKHGCIFTEYAPGTPPERYNFPRRNRIISGLSHATVVVEGRENSGALITARHAKAQNRPVFAFPGNVYNKGSQVTNNLIKNGAIMCTFAEDVINHFEKSMPGTLNQFLLLDLPKVDMWLVLSKLKVSSLAPSDSYLSPPRAKKKTVTVDDMFKPTVIPPQNPLPEFDPLTLKLYKMIPIEGSCTVSSLINDDFDTKTVMSLLLKLEMGKFIAMLPGDRVKRNLR